MKERYIAITDINRSRFKPWVEIDDIESLLRLLLYSNEIDIEGIIACTSCFLKKGARRRHLNIIYDIIDTYGKVKSNLDVHSKEYPSAKYLRSVACLGIPEFGEAPEKGFAQKKFNENPGVNRIIEAVDKEDERPLWIGLWGGANTLAQAIWKVEQTRSPEKLNQFLSKLRVYGISDQDNSSSWIRKKFGDRLFYIVSPSLGTMKGTKGYYQSVWAGIAGDTFTHGSEDGTKGGGFSGARTDLVSKTWLKENIIDCGIYGKKYLFPVFLMEGDSPTYMGLIQNGLNVPERPDYGGWGGRYEYYRPKDGQFQVNEKYPIWTNASDQVIGIDEKLHRSPQATIWRWREAFQNDFAARMRWTITSDYQKANHAPFPIISGTDFLTAAPGEKIVIDASESYDPDGDDLQFHWFYYKEAGNYQGELEIEDAKSKQVLITVPNFSEGQSELMIHVILELRDSGKPKMTSYRRIQIRVI